MFENVFQDIVAYGAAAIWIIVLVIWAIWYFKNKNIEDKPEGTIEEFEEDSAEESTNEKDSAEKNKNQGDQES